jgi:hypothetical protein
MSIFGKLLKTAIDVALVPVAIVSDIPRVVDPYDDSKTNTEKALENIADDINGIRDEADKL